ncbi:MAG: Rne/Rng family ribonuclease [Candidatus Binatus sp.]|uniref:Rne/Rng family ribonuclease n=1 Tax=Candidatus Binatus sp. TaxID=2811406 RepID=UPI0027194CA3|nr:Rne/Rng family ribonuclease [Candidatus Binatus sp.]MDO8433117.1 Rne/Rng family ribonuclease [Candidatus Binatus sp.]
MKREIAINASALEVRVAVLEDNELAEFYLERNRQVGLAGNIYKGKVTRVLPGMQAAFVDIGLEKAGFLHVSDFQDGISALSSVAEVIGEEDVETEPLGENGDGEIAFEEPAAPDGASQPAAEQPSRRRRGGRGQQKPQRSNLPIEQQLRRGQEIIVQIAKEPMGTKGARLTSSISLPGRHLVFTPTSNHIGVSRRIASAEERARLRADVGELRPAQGGFIVRTACEGVSRREIQRDVAFLTKLWASILRKNESMPPASILYSDLDVALRVMRDLFSSEVDRLWCDEPNTYSRIVQFVQNYMPRLRNRVSLHDGNEPLFDRFNIEPQIERALDRKVWLKSGGYLVFDQAEALTAIDVNTGRFVGKRSQDDTVFKTNLEAVEEVVNQLRLRNIGGIIIVDFIDMEREGDRKKVSDALALALKRDKARTSALKISELGLVQMTRKRTRESLEKLLTDTCPRCEGRRVVKSVPTIAAEVLRGIQREAVRRGPNDLLVVKLNPEVARYLYDHGAKDLETLEHRLSTKIVLRSSDNLEGGAFELAQAPAAA